jgi:hypothetical protein
MKDELSLRRTHYLIVKAVDFVEHVLTDASDESGYGFFGAEHYRSYDPDDEDAPLPPGALLEREACRVRPATAALQRYRETLAAATSETVSCFGIVAESAHEVAARVVQRFFNVVGQMSQGMELTIDYQYEFFLVACLTREMVNCNLLAIRRGLLKAFPGVTHADFELLRAMLRKEIALVAADEKNEELPANAVDRKPEQLQLTPAVATVVVGLQCMIALGRIRFYYPSAIGHDEANGIYQQLVDTVERCLQADDAGAIRDIYRRPTLDSIPNEEVAVALSLAMMNLSGKADTTKLEEAFRATFTNCLSQAQEPVRTICHQLSEVELYDCREVTPDAGSEYSDPRRSLFLLNEYWGIVRRVVSVDSTAYAFSIPHPLITLLINLRERINSCLDRISESIEPDEAKETSAYFMNALITSDSDEMQACEEETNRRLAQMETFIEEAKLKIGRRTYTLTAAEEQFFEVARLALTKYESDHAARKKSFDTHLAQEAALRRPASTGEVLPSQPADNKTDRIPPEERTIPLTFRRAAKLMGKAGGKDAAEWLSASVKDGSIRCEHITRQTHVFSKLDFPGDAWPLILPKAQ